MIDFKLTADDFFGGIFIGSYVCALQPERGGQMNGCIPSLESEKPGFESYDKLIEDRFFELNNNGYGIHFSPNGMGNVLLRNKKENVTHVNAWWVEIDIDETKHLGEDEVGQMEKREDRKARLRWNILDCGLIPSLTVETRNGFQVYWFALDGKLENFEKIEELIYAKFQHVGADKSAMVVWHTLRVPYFKYSKDGEHGFIQVFEWLSNLELYSEERIFEWLKEERAVVEIKKKETIVCGFLDSLDQKHVDLRQYNKPNTETIFDRINRTPITLVLERLSGKDEVRGDQFTLTPVNSTGKANVLVNGQSTPNWIDVNKNLIFSNNVSGMATMIHYLEYYGMSKKEAIQLLSTIIQ